MYEFILNSSYIKNERKVIYESQGGQVRPGYDSEKIAKQFRQRIELLDFYLKEVIGLFDPDTQNIYVGNFVDSCKQQAVVAHELAHYLQVLEKGKVDPESYDAESKRFGREMEASRIEIDFIKTFCSASADSWVSD